MVLNFEAKKYNSIGERILFCLFKMGYVSRKYCLCPKVFYTIYVSIEIIFLIFLLSVNECDIYNPDIKSFGNFFSSSYNKNLLYYKNFDNEMSFIINFLNFTNTMNLSYYIIGISVIFLIFVVKIVEFVYFLKGGVPVIQVSSIIKVFYYLCGMIDLVLRTYGDILILIICTIMLSCPTGGTSLLIETMTCWQGTHLVLVIIVSFLLFLLFCNLCFQIMFFDVSNLLESDNFGMADNLRCEFIHFVCKIILVVLNILILRPDQEVIKLWIYFVFTFVILVMHYRNIVKFHNFYMNIIIYKHASMFIYSGMMIPYAHLQKDITLPLFLFILIITFLGGYIILYLLKRTKTSTLYGRV